MKTRGEVVPFPTRDAVGTRRLFIAMLTATRRVPTQIMGFDIEGIAQGGNLTYVISDTEESARSAMTDKALESLSPSEGWECHDVHIAEVAEDHLQLLFDERAGK